MAIDVKGIYGYLSNCAWNTVSVIDLLSNRETGRIAVGDNPRALSITPLSIVEVNYDMPEKFKEAY